MRRITNNLGMLLLSIWLIIWGLVQLVPALSGAGIVLAILALVAGIFLLFNR